MQHHEPQVYAKACHVLLPKDYIRFKLTGEYAMDKADGAGTVLMDLKQRDWSEEVLAGLEIPRAWMPPLFEGTQITGPVTPAAAAATGLQPGTPVMAGGGDQAAQAVGVGAVREGVVALTLGTSGVVFATTYLPPAANICTDAGDGFLYAFDARTGKPVAAIKNPLTGLLVSKVGLSSVNPQLKGSGIPSAPIIRNGKLYLSVETAPSHPRQVDLGSRPIDVKVKTWQRVK